jgi:hypothetical protein
MLLDTGIDDVKKQRNAEYAKNINDPVLSSLKMEGIRLLFLVGVRKRSSLCPIPTNNFGRSKNNLITTAVNSVTQDILLRVWNEFSYLLDVTRVAGGEGGNIKHL